VWVEVASSLRALGIGGGGSDTDIGSLSFDGDGDAGDDLDRASASSPRPGLVPRRGSPNVTGGGSPNLGGSPGLTSHGSPGQSPRSGDPRDTLVSTADGAQTAGPDSMDPQQEQPFDLGAIADVDMYALADLAASAIEGSDDGCGKSGYV
jgi:hypothetical protein